MPRPPTGPENSDAPWCGQCARWQVVYVQTGSFSRICSGTSVHSARGVAASFLTCCRGSCIFVSVAAASSASCRDTSQQNIAFQMFLQLQTLRRLPSRPVATGVSCSQKDVAASWYVCSRGADNGIVWFCPRWLHICHRVPFSLVTVAGLSGPAALPHSEAHSRHLSRVRRVLPGISKSFTGSAVVVFDSIEGRSVQTKTVLRCTARHSKFVRGQGACIPWAVFSPRLSCSSWRFSSFCAYFLLLRRGRPRARDSRISSSLFSGLDISPLVMELFTLFPCSRLTSILAVPSSNE